MTRTGWKLKCIGSISRITFIFICTTHKHTTASTQYGYAKVIYFFLQCRIYSLQQIWSHLLTLVCYSFFYFEMNGGQVTAIALTKNVAYAYAVVFV